MDADLARTLAAHPRFRWAAGMRAVGRRGLPDAWMRVEEPLARLSGEWAQATPDLADAATAGVLLDMLADAMPLRAVQVVRERPNLGTPYRWWVESYTGSVLGEAAGLALLALWGPA